MVSFFWFVNDSRPPQCGICDANSTDPAMRHPIEDAIDGSPRWWQSPSVAHGSRYEYVTIVIDMRQVPCGKFLGEITLGEI